ncbi:GntR family transcriptional regulator, partial [Acinetobacter ursingii]
RPHKALSEHIRILDAISDCDAELAELLMCRHISSSYRNIQKHFI